MDLQHGKAVEIVSVVCMYGVLTSDDAVVVSVGEQFSDGSSESYSRVRSSQTEVVIITSNDRASTQVH